jgi:protein arginine N-methyltransferase 1
MPARWFALNMYSLEAYGKMAADTIRTGAYLAALERSVTSGSVVIDLGCGPGIFALHACRLGARKVYAIEPSDSIQIARDLAEANGLSERIEFIQDISTKVNLPERADIIVADLRGILPFYGASMASMIDARERFLAPGGLLIPQADRLWGTLIANPGLYARSVLPWEAALPGFELFTVRTMAANTIYKIRTSSEEYLADPREIAAIDYRSVVSSACDAESSWAVTRDGIAHGIAIWFDAELASGVGFSNAPGPPELLYGTAFFPFCEPLPVHAGDRVCSHIRADQVGDDYIWRWNASLNGKLGLEQSTFFGMALSADSLPHFSRSGPGSGPESGQ